MRRDGSVEAWASLLDLCPSNRCCPTRQLATARLPRPEIPGVRVILGPLLPDEMGPRSVEWLMKDSTAPKRSSPPEPRNFRRGQMYSSLEGNLDFYFQHPPLAVFDEK